MRYKYIALLALAVMFFGVMGIYRSVNNNDKENQKNVKASFDVIYYRSAHELERGMLVTQEDFKKKKITVSQKQPPAWLNDAVSEQDFIDLFTHNGIGVMQQTVAGNGILKRGTLINLSEILDSELVAIPLNVSWESIQNPKIKNRDFVDIYLISNDNKVYREDIYNKKLHSGGTGKDYKDTRVKKFASNVWIDKAMLAGNPQKSKDGLSVMDSSALVENRAGASKINEDGDTTKIIYAWFKRKDLDTVIQAQVLGSFFVSPRSIKMIPDKLSEVAVESREITPADIVSGAPLAEKKSKVVEIRGAGYARKYN